MCSEQLRRQSRDAFPFQRPISPTTPKNEPVQEAASLSKRTVPLTRRQEPAASDVRRPFLALGDDLHEKTRIDPIVRGSTRVDVIPPEIGAAAKERAHEQSRLEKFFLRSA